MEIELANILDVPVLTAGEFVSHNAGPLVITEDDLDEIVEGSNELQPVIMESISTGAYAGNDDLTAKLSKPIPGLINLKHQAILPDTMKQITQGVTTSFKKALIDGKHWIVQQFKNVPDDIAKTLQSEYPFRSVELLPLKNPSTGRFFSKVIRSTAFLDKFTPPAVPGQSPDLVMEFSAAEEPLIILTTQGVTAMQEPTTQTVDSKADVSELQKVKDTLAELQAQLAAEKLEKDKAVELAMQQNEAKNAEIAELKAFRNTAESDKMIMELSRIRRVNDKAYQVSPAFLDIVKPVIQAGGIVELSEGQSQRQAMFAMLDEIAELSATGNCIVPLTTQGAEAFKPPEQEDEGEQLETITSELMAKDPGLTQDAAMKKAFIAMLNRQYGGSK